MGHQKQPGLILFLCLTIWLSSLPARAVAPSPVDGFEPEFSYANVLVIQPDGKMITSSLNRLRLDGSIDPSFKAAASGPGDVNIYSIAILQDGKFLVAGKFSRMNGVEINSVARLKNDGTLDITFNPETAANDLFYAMGIQPDGRIVLCGDQYSSGTSKAVITQLNPDGSLIKRFDPTDKVVRAHIYSMAVQPDGKLLLGGLFESINGIVRASIARLNPDCTVDTSFISNLDGGHVVHSILVQKDARIAICGNFGLARVNANGSPDPTFIRSITDCTYDFEILSDGQYILATQTGLKKLLPTGKPDPTFLCGTSFNANWVADQHDGKILTGGSLSIGRSSIEYFMRLNENGSRDTTFNPGLSPNDWVFNIIMQPDGKALLSGNFTQINGTSEQYLARLNADGALDTGFNIGSDIGFRELQAIVPQSDGKVLLAGFFDKVHGVSRGGIARLDDDGSVDTTFNPVVSGFTWALAVQADGKILAGGNLTKMNGIPRNGIARLNVDGSLDETFVPSIPADGEISPVVALRDGKVVLGRTPLTGALKHELIRLNANGSLDTAFQSGLETDIHISKILEQPDGNLLIAGDFGVIRLNDNGSTDTTFNADALTNSFIQNIALQSDGKILAAGQELVRLNSDGSLDTAFETGSGPGKVTHYYWGEPSSTILALAVKPDGKILAGGKFQYFDGTPCNYIVELNSDGSVDRASQYLSTGTNSPVRALATQLDGNVPIGGDFTSLNGLDTKYIARLNGDTGTLDQRFGLSTDAVVNAVAPQPDGKIFIAGAFTTINGTARGRVARLNADGSLDTNYSLAGANNDVNALAVRPNGNMVLAGNFTRVNGNICNRVAELNPDGSFSNQFGTGANDEVDGVAVQPDGKIVLGGKFTIVRANPRNRIARLNANGLIDHSFAPTGTNGPVRAVAIQSDGKILIGGDFRNVNGASLNRFARLNADGSLDASFNPGPGANGAILSIALQADGRIQIAGEFTTVGGMDRNRIARLNADGSLDTTYDPGSGADNNVLGIALQSDGKTLLGGDFTTIKGCARRHFARLSNPDAAMSSLAVGRESMTWSLKGSAPQPYQAMFERSTDGKSWQTIGWGTPVAGVGFSLENPGIPIAAGEYVRSTGWVSGGRYNGSVSLVRSTVNYFDDTRQLNAARDWAYYR